MGKKSELEDKVDELIDRAEADRRAAEAMKPPVVEDEHRTIREILAAQPKYKIRLPVQGNIPAETVCINGYNFVIKRGEECAVPQAVYKILIESHLI